MVCICKQAKALHTKTRLNHRRSMLFRAADATTDVVIHESVVVEILSLTKQRIGGGFIHCYGVSAFPAAWLPPPPPLAPSSTCSTSATAGNRSSTYLRCRSNLHGQWGIQHRITCVNEHVQSRHILHLRYNGATYTSSFFFCPPKMLKCPEC